MSELQPPPLSAIAAATSAAQFDSEERLPRRQDGHIPTVPRQWLYVVADSGLVATWDLLAERVARLSKLLIGDIAKLGRQLPNALRGVAEARAFMSCGIGQLGWFRPAGDPQLLTVVDALIADAEETLVAVQYALATAACGGLDQAVADGSAQAAVLREAFAAGAEDQTPPRELVGDVFRVTDADALAAPGLDANLLRGRTALSADQLDALSRRFLAHLLPDGIRWMPSPTEYLPALLMAERPLVAHRVALASRDLTLHAARRSVKGAAAVLAVRRSAGERGLATFKEITAELRELRRAEAAGESEAAALATARLYAAEVEGPARRASMTLLGLHGEEPSEQVSLSVLRDRLRATADLAGADLVAAIEPEWRNAVDHREAYWDPAREQLVLREHRVRRGEVFARYARAAGASVGVECGIAVAIAATPGLLEAIDRAAPVRGDRVLVEHRLGGQLAAHGIQPPAVSTTARGPVVGPIERDDLVKTLAAVVTCRDELQGAEAVRIDVDGLPPLMVTPRALRSAAKLQTRDGQNRKVLDPDAVAPILIDAAIALGSAAEDALDRGVEAALRGVVASAQPHPDMTRTRVARRLVAASRRAQQVLREATTVAGVTSPAAREIAAALRRLERAGTTNVRGGGARDLVRTLKRIFELADALPRDPFPWFDERVTSRV